MSSQSKVLKLKERLDELELQACEDLTIELKNIQRKRDEVKKTYVSKVEAVKKEYANEKKQLENICAKSDELISNIERKLFDKKKRSIAVSHTSYMPPDMLLEDLEHEIDKFESYKISKNLQELFDNIAVIFSSNYKQSEIDKIVKMNQQIKLCLNNGELEKKWAAEIKLLREEEQSILAEIDGSVIELLERYSKQYIKKVQNAIFS